MNKYLRNEAIGTAFIFLLVALWRYLSRNSVYDQLYKVEIIELVIMALALLCIALFYSKSCMHIYVLFIGTGILGIASGIGIGSVITMRYIHTVNFSELYPSWEYLGITAVSLLALIIWIYRTGKASTSSNQT